MTDKNKLKTLKDIEDEPCDQGIDFHYFKIREEAEKQIECYREEVKNMPDDNKNYGSFHEIMGKIEFIREFFGVE